MIEELPPPQNDGPQMIEHHIWGKGRVLSFDNKRKVYSVQFDGMSQPRSINADYFNQKHEKHSLSLPQPDLSDSLKDVEDIIESFVVPSRRNVIAPNPEEKEEPDYKNLPPYEEEIEQEEYEFQTEEKVEVPGGMETGEEIEIEVTEEPEENFTAEEELPPDLRNISDELREKLANSPNHWDDPDYPKTGWICTGVTDLGAPEGICQMCGYQIIRYVHHMYHPETGNQLNCGCVCAGKLEGDINKARKREAAFKNKLQRKINFKKKQWKRSARGHEYLKIKNHLIVIFHFKDSNKWKFSIDNNFSKTVYNSRNDCIEAIFNALEELLYGKL